MEAAFLANVVDIAVVLVMALGMLQGYRRGLSGELARLAGVVAAFVAGLYAFGPFGDWCLGHTRLGPRAAKALAFTATVTGSILVMVLLRFTLGRIMKVVIDNEADRAGGLVAGLFRSCAFALIVFVLMNLWPHDYLNRLFGEGSFVGRALLRALPELRADREEAETREGNSRRPSWLQRKRSEKDHVQGHP